MRASPPVDDPAALSAIVVAGTHSGVGKTSVTLGLLGAFRRRGLTVQPFKVGPDFIDPLHHAHASGRPPRNLDGWMLSPQANLERFAAATWDADVAVIEGVMGLFDGSEGRSDRGSTAEMAKLLALPVILVVDASAMARSAAALIHGFTSFDPRLRVAGVILNNVGGQAHTDMIGDAVAGAVPILGALPRSGGLEMPERHLGLHLPHEAREDYVEQLATLIERHLDIDELLATSRVGRRPPPPIARAGAASVRIAVGRDEAFCFYYADNLELLKHAGAEFVEFSPLRDPLPENVDGLYIGGGYPELHAAQLADNTSATGAIRDFVSAGGPVYGECGGLMYLARELEVDGTSFPMCGVLPFGTKMPAPLKLSYVEIHTTGGLFGAGHTARGHLFHHSAIVQDSTIFGRSANSHSYELVTSGGERRDEGYQVGNVLASYVHLHFASQPALARAFVERCASSGPRAAGSAPT